MGVSPELVGNLFPTNSGWMFEGRSVTEASGPSGKASRRHRRDSRIRRDHVPEQFGLRAHDGGISPFLGFSS
jgi:hypothetical protein